MFGTVLLVACGGPVEPRGGGEAPDAAPDVRIEAPADGSRHARGGAVTLIAVAIDGEDGELSDTIAWASDAEGPLGRGSRLSVVLGEGPHLITASVQDSAGNAGSDAVSIVVVEASVPTLTPSRLSMVVGERATLVVEPASATAAGVTWRSRDDTVATVDESGRVTALSAGTTQVEAVLTERPSTELVATVEVRLPELAIDEVSASPSPSAKGAKVTLSWRVTAGADAVGCAVRAPDAFEDGIEGVPCQEGVTLVELMFADAGRFTVAIEVTRPADGARLEATTTVVVGLPEVTRAVARPDRPAARTVVQFEASARDPDETPVTCTLDPGDGSAPVGMGRCDEGTARVEHVYEAPGSYRAVVRATDAEGEVGQRGTWVEVGPPPPLQATLRSETWGGIAGDRIAFEMDAGGGVEEPRVTSWTVQRVDGPVVEEARGADLPTRIERTFHEPGSYRVRAEITDGTTTLVRERTVTLVEAALGSKPALVIFGFAGRCGADCDADANQAYLEEAGRRTLSTLAGAFEERIPSEVIRIYEFRAHLLDSDVHGRGYQTAALLARRMNEAWIDGVGEPTRLVVVGYSYGNTFASLLSFANPDVPFAYGIYLDALCGAAGVSFDEDHLDAGHFARAYGAQAAYPAPLSSQPRACDGYPVDGAGTRGIDDVVPSGIEVALEAQSGGDSGFTFISDQVDNLRPDGTRAGITTRRFTQDAHRGIERHDSSAMAWLVQTIAALETP